MENKISFEELKQLIKENAKPPYWNYEYKNCIITHEDDETYLISVKNSDIVFRKEQYIQIEDYTTKVFDKNERLIFTLYTASENDWKLE